ncbi:MAG: hypothetical protein H6742_17795 [Alphaproteobacteria bacterium]|nr:hypothetical protein [Alphaproteobacteria bacterium]
MRLSARAATIIALSLLSPVAFAKKDKKKKKGEEPVVIEGWHKEEGWTAECYYPPKWTELGFGDRKTRRSEVLDAMMSQWTGQRGDGIAFDEEKATDAETVLLGRPDDIEAVSIKNLELCKQAVAVGGDTGAWRSWLNGIPARLTEGECKSPPLDYTMFDYLDIGADWQRPLGICEGDHIQISGTAKDRFRVSSDGDWINVDGDPAQSAVGTDLPCNTEGCFRGQLIMRYQADSGWEKIIPVGTGTTFQAPEHGTIMYRINDDSFFDNVWYKSRGLEDHTAIEVSPAQ